MKRSFAAAAAAITLIPLAAAAQQSDDEWLEQCRERDDHRLVTFCEVRVERLAATRTIDVDARPNGGIQVIGWNRNEVEVHARIQTRARTDRDAEALADAIEILTNGGRIRSDGPDHERDANWHASFVVYTPVRSNVLLEAHNGPVSVRGVNGSMEVRTHNGPLSLREVGGDIIARTQNGPLNVDLTGSHWDGEGLDAETHNGPVNLSIPEGYSADLETGTVNGPMHSDVPLMVQFVGRRTSQIETTLGSGGAPIRVVTTNGPVNLRQR